MEGQIEVQEIFAINSQAVEPAMKRANLTDYLRAGVFLCGGGSRVPQSK